MTKTKRNILLTMLSFLMAICALFISTMPSTVAKADSTYRESYLIEARETEFVFDTSNFVVEGVIQDWSEIIEKPVRLYEESFLEITGYNGAYLMSSFILWRNQWGWRKEKRETRHKTQFLQACWAFRVWTHSEGLAQLEPH